MTVLYWGAASNGEAGVYLRYDGRGGWWCVGARNEERDGAAGGDWWLEEWRSWEAVSW